MRIIYLHQYFNTPAMAGGTRSYEMARRLVDRGHEVHMITSWRKPSTRRGWYTEIIDGIIVHWLPVQYSNQMGFAARVRAFLAFAFGATNRAVNLSADVVFATSTPLTIALPGVYASKRLRVPLVFEVRDLWPEVPIALGVLRNPILKWLAYRLEKFAYRHSSRIVALAPGMAQSIIRQGVDPRRVSIIPNSCDVELFASEAITSLPSEKIVVYIGTVGPANGVHYLPKLAASIKKHHPDANIRFIVIGDGKELERVKALAASLGLSASDMEFLGSLAKNEIPSFLSRSRASIMTYDGPEVVFRDSVSNKFFDSLAAGRVVVANFSGFSTLVAQKENVGVILPRDDIDKAADQLVNLLLNDKFLSDGSRKAQALARDMFSRDRCAEMLESVLIQAAEREELSDDVIGDEFRVLWQSACSREA